MDMIIGDITFDDIRQGKLVSNDSLLCALALVAYKYNGKLDKLITNFDKVRKSANVKLGKFDVGITYSKKTYDLSVSTDLNEVWVNLFELAFVKYMFILNNFNNSKIIQNEMKRPHSMNKEEYDLLKKGITKYPDIALNLLLQSINEKPDTKFFKFEKNVKPICTYEKIDGVNATTSKFFTSAFFDNAEHHFNNNTEIIDFIKRNKLTSGIVSYYPKKFLFRSKEPEKTTILDMTYTDNNIYCLCFNPRRTEPLVRNLPKEISDKYSKMIYKSLTTRYSDGIYVIGLQEILKTTELLYLLR